MLPVRLRLATAADAALVADLINALDRTEGGPGRATAEIVLRHGFGTRPLFEVVLAEAGGRAVGYALYYDAFDSVRAAPALSRACSKAGLSSASTRANTTSADAAAACGVLP